MNNETERKAKAKEIIQNFATASATAAAALSQGAIFGADTATLSSLHLEMAKKIAEIFGRELEPQIAQDLLQKAAKIHTGAVISKSLLGWLPVIGNAANAAITFKSTQAIGWFFYKYFEAQGA